MDVSIMKPVDLCFDCQPNSTLLMRSANLMEEIKSERLKIAQKHLALARLQRHHYTDQCEPAKKALESTDTTPTYLHACIIALILCSRYIFRTALDSPVNFFFLT